MEKIEFDLVVCNFLPESNFVEIYGEEGRNIYEKLSAEAFARNGGKCASCGVTPGLQLPVEAANKKKKECLRGHIYDIDKTDLSKSKVITLCRACHATQHVDSAIEKKWVKFVNSTHSQNHIVRLCRIGGLEMPAQLRGGAIIDLKKAPEEFSKEIKSGAFKASRTLKVRFTENFTFDDF